MTVRNYPACLKHILKWEGGYVDHPSDPGGATNHGITRATLARHRGHPVSKQDVRDLMVSEAGEIYRPKYWNTVRGNDLPEGLDLVAFDASVNSGPSRGIRWLQAGLGVAADGVIGPRTLAAARNGSRVQRIQRACAARMSFLRGLRTWGVFGRGWSRRVADTEATAVTMVVGSVAFLKVEADSAKEAARVQAGGAGGTAVTGAGSGLFDMPDWALFAVLIAAGAVAIILTMKAAHHARRADAYRAKAKERTYG